MKFKIGYIAAAVTVVTFAPITASAHDNGYHHRHQSSGNDQAAGAVIGAIAGGVIGSQVAGNGARTEGSVLGAVVGGLAGAAIAGDNRSRTYGNVRYHQGGQYNHRAPSYGHTYYSRPTYSYRTHAPRYYSNHTYRRPVYNHYSRPHYSRPYYQNRPNVSISIGSGGYYGGGHGYRSHRPKYRRNYRRHR